MLGIIIGIIIAIIIIAIVIEIISFILWLFGSIIVIAIVITVLFAVLYAIYLLGGLSAVVSAVVGSIILFFIIKNIKEYVDKIKSKKCADYLLEHVQKYAGISDGEIRTDSGLSGFKRENICAALELLENKGSIEKIKMSQNEYLYINRTSNGEHMQSTEITAEELNLY